LNFRQHFDFIARFLRLSLYQNKSVIYVTQVRYAKLILYQANRFFLSVNNEFNTFCIFDCCLPNTHPPCAHTGGHTRMTTTRKPSPYFSALVGPMPWANSSSERLRGRSKAMSRRVRSLATT